LNGTPTADYIKSVFMMHVPEPPMGYTICTGTNVRYPRCILTAAHCVDPQKTPLWPNSVWWQGLDPGSHPYPDPKKYASEPQKAARYTQNYDIWKDLAVVWLE